MVQGFTTGNFNCESFFCNTLTPEVACKPPPDDFSEDSEIVWLISGIADKSYFVARCREDLEYGVDYVNGSRRGHLKLTPHGALLMLLNLRSRRGVAVRYMPQKVEIEIPKSICSGKNSKINRRQLQAQ